jgi:hypothetical protein
MRLRINIVVPEGPRLRLVPAGEEVAEGQVPENARRFQCQEATRTDEHSVDANLQPLFAKENLSKGNRHLK